MNRLVTVGIIDETEWVGRDQGGLHVLHMLWFHILGMGCIVHLRCFRASLQHIFMMFNRTVLWTPYFFNQILCVIITFLLLVLLKSDNKYLIYGLVMCNHGIFKNVT